MAAFANSDGGTLIIGVPEANQTSLEPDGIAPGITREQIDQSIRNNVTPPIEGLRVAQLQGPLNKSAIVITVPASQQPPHQASDGRYYRRYEFHNHPMAHHEIEDLRRRRLKADDLVVVSIAIRGSNLSAIDVHNPGTLSAVNVNFTFPPTMRWPNDTLPEPLRNGIGHLGPQQRLRFRYLTFAEVFADQNNNHYYDVEVTYRHPIFGERARRTWSLDFEAYRGSMSVISDEQQWRNDLLSETKKVAASVDRLEKCLSDSLPVLTGANGLDLSVRTLRDLRSIFTGRSFDKLPSEYLNYRFFRDAFSIDTDLAWKLQQFFQKADVTRAELLNIPGMTVELLLRVEEILRLPFDSPTETPLRNE